MTVTGYTKAGADAAIGVETARASAAETLLAPKASPALTGTPTVPTAAPGTNSAQAASTAYADAAAIAAAVGLLDYRGTFNASGNAFPSSGGSGSAGAILKGDFWIVSTPGTLGGTAVSNGDLVIALTDTPGSTAANWDLVEHDIGYAPENAANKSTDGTLAANSTTLYPSQSAVKTFVNSKTLPSLIRAVTVAYAATITPNADTTDVLNIGALTGNITLANPTGTPVDGQVLRSRMSQDGTGSRTVSFGTAYAFGTDVTSSLIPSAASSKWEMLFIWNAADSKWRAGAIIRGF